MTVGLSTARAAALCRGMYGNVSPKRGNRLYYKGKGGLKPGRHTKHGRYVLDPKRKKELGKFNCRIAFKGNLVLCSCSRVGRLYLETICEP